VSPGLWQRSWAKAFIDEKRREQDELGKTFPCKDLNRETMGNKQKLRTFFLTFLFLGGLLKENEDRDDVGDKTEE